MKISELIKQLEEAMSKYGDKEIEINVMSEGISERITHVDISKNNKELIHIFTEDY